jgi:ribonuclease-3
VRRAEKALGVTFDNPLLLEQSLVHRSYLNENAGFASGSNERLEYLGDAIVGLVIAEHLYTTFPEASEGVLTAMRATIVRLQTLGRAARSIGLGDLLFRGRGEEAATGRKSRRPLGQAFEAVIGAIYLDKGMPATRDVILRLLRPDLDRLGTEQYLRDAKSLLQEATQAGEGAAPMYRVVSATGPGHQPHFVVEVVLGDRVLATGEGDKKKEAEQLAARSALANWPKPESS